MALHTRILFFSLLLSLTATPDCASPPAPDPATIRQVEARLAQARQSRTRGELLTAQMEARSAIALDPRHAGSHYELALALDADGDSPGAFAALEQSLKLNPDHAAALRLLGYLLLNAGSWEQSAAASQRAIELNPVDVAAQVNLGYALARLGETDRAYFHYQKALASAPQHKEALLYSAALLAAMRRIDEAQALFETAVRYHPDSAEAHYSLANFLINERLDPIDLTVDGRPHESPQSKKYRDSARDLLERSLKLQPDLGPAYARLTYLAMRSGDYTAAIQSARQALALEPDASSNSTRYNLALAYYSTAQYELARVEFRRVLDAFPDTQTALLFYANASLHLGDVQAALDGYTRLIELNDAHGLAHLNLAKIYASQGNQAKTNEHLKAACTAGETEACR